MDRTDIVLFESSNIKILKRSSGNVVVVGCNDLLIVINGPDILITSNKGDYHNQLKEIVTNINK